MKTLYVHIGTPKTGTKSIQSFCWENRQVLEKSGCCYPDLSALCPQCVPIKNGHFLLEQEEEREEGCGMPTAYTCGLAQVRKLFSSFDNVVLSDEGIYRETYRRRASLWQELKDEGERAGFSVKIIVYLRRQDMFLESLWNQHIKMKKVSTSEQSWEEFMSAMPKSLQLDYYEKLESIASVLGRDHVIVRRFESDTFFGGSIYADFLQAIGMELTEEYDISREKRNTSLQGNTHEIMRTLNGVSEFSQEELAFMRRILRTVGEISQEQYQFSMFSPKECRRLLGRYRKSNRQVAEKYLGEHGTDLFHHTISDLPKWTADNPYMQQDVIRFLAMGMITLRKRNKQLRRKYRKLKERVDNIDMFLFDKA